MSDGEVAEQQLVSEMVLQFAFAMSFLAADTKDEMRLSFTVNNSLLSSCCIIVLMQNIIEFISIANSSLIAK